MNGSSSSDWLLRPDIHFLNHGSFGSTPRVVFEAQEQWRRRIEAEPIELLGRQCHKLLAEARGAVGPELGMKPEDFGFVTNATEGVNAVLRSIPLGPGDELLTTDHVYHAVRQAMKNVAKITGAAYREVAIPLPVHSADEIAGRVLEALGPKTKLLVIDHVTSPTALVFPIEQIIRGCRERGVDVLVDGAHAPGMIDLNIEALAPAYYAGNLHKWICAPKGAAFLWVRPDLQPSTHPAVVSHFWNEGFQLQFGWQGTRDISSWLAVPAAIDFFNSLGRTRIRGQNHATAVWAHRVLVDGWKTEPISPLDGSLLGSMAAARLPMPLDRMTRVEGDVLQQRLYTEHKVEMPLFYWNQQWLGRVSCQVYNRSDDYHAAVKAIVDLSAKLA